MMPHEAHAILRDKGILPPPPMSCQDVTEEAQKCKVINALQYAVYRVQDAIALANPYVSKDTPRDLWKSGTIQEIEADLRYVIDELSK